mmetsp:Transcript_22355/g.51504  ORF Transcript_22355/g.51504 Transcript_22355/m.51504 type:complete len:255 (-) Transcript_22355:198-962(-)
MAANKLRVHRIQQTSRSYDLDAERKVFVGGFTKNYSQIDAARKIFGDPQEMKKFLNEAFDDEVKAFLQQDDITDSPAKFAAYHGVVEGSIVAFVSVDVNRQDRSVYFRQLAVSAEWQSRGVGRAFVSSVMQQIEHEFLGSAQWISSSATLLGVGTLCMMALLVRNKKAPSILELMLGVGAAVAAGWTANTRNSLVKYQLCVRRFNAQGIDFYRSLGFFSDEDDENDPTASVGIQQQHGLDPVAYAAMSLERQVG